MNTYVIPDLHGRYDMLMRAIAAIKRHANGKYNLVVLGDMVDRGPHSRQIIEYLMKYPEIVVLKGNHEQMMLDAYRDRVNIPQWTMNGGTTTLLSYGQNYGDRADPQTYIPWEHYMWLTARPMLHKDNYRLYVHAMVDETLPLDEQKEATLLWGLYPNGYKNGHSGFHVVHGHHIHENGPLVYEGRTALDVGYRNKLAIAVFDDETPGKPVDIIMVYDDRN